MKRSFALALMLYFGFMLTAAAASEYVIESALQDIGAGSAEKIKERIILRGFVIPSKQHHAQAFAELPDSVRGSKITRGSLVRRAEAALEAVLRLYDRSGTIELILYKSEIPSAALRRGCVLIISDALAGPMTDAELTGIIAHEMGHTYFMDEILAAQRAKDARGMQVVELKCDAVAILTLKLLGRNPDHYLSGLQKIKRTTDDVGVSSKLTQTHPDVRERAQFIERFKKLLASSV